MIAMLVALAVAALSYAGAVRPEALFLFVLPTMLLTAIACLRVDVRRHPLVVAAIGIGVALALAEVVNVISGLSYGPAARSSFASAVGTAVAVAAARSRYPAVFLLAVSEVIGGALALGAGGEVKLVAVATAVCALVALARLEAERARWVGRSGAGASVFLALMVVGAVAMTAVVLQDQRVTRHPAVLFPALADRQVHPFWHEHAPSPKPRPTHKQGSTARRQATAAGHRAPTWPRMIVGALLVVLLLVVLLAAIRLLVVRMTWRRFRRRLQRGDPASACVGAWIWTQTWLAAGRRSLPPHVSPDQVADAVTDLPEAAVEPLTTLGAAAALGAFGVAGSLTPADAASAWRAADGVAAAVRDGESAAERARRSWRVPVIRLLPVQGAAAGSSVRSGA